jgi:4-diphosphocytidyl-2-C-methyl-D-erythritol kinase
MLRLFSPAKINLFLRIVSKRADGYHDLSSVFQTIALGDTLTVELHPTDILTCTNPQLPTDSSNLVLKATELFRRKTGLQHAFKIHLEKQIPMQAGLGGGSSNAATTLWACNQLTNAHIPLHTLKQWGAEIGSDIPFFLSQGTAYCTGRGEHVHHLPALASRPLWIVKPFGGLSTPEVYRSLNLAHSSSEEICQRDLDAFLAGELTYFNDLEAPAFKIRPELEQLKMRLMVRGFDTVLMTGSGSAFFCLGEGTPPEHRDLAVFPVHFINRTLSEWYPLNTHFNIQSYTRSSITE